MGAAPERPDEMRPVEPIPVDPESENESPFDTPSFEEVEKGLKPSEVPSR